MAAGSVNNTRGQPRGSDTVSTGYRALRAVAAREATSGLTSSLGLFVLCLGLKPSPTIGCCACRGPCVCPLWNLHFPRDRSLLSCSPPRRLAASTWAFACCPAEGERCTARCQLGRAAVTTERRTSGLLPNRPAARGPRGSSKWHGALRPVAVGHGKGLQSSLLGAAVASDPRELIGVESKIVHFGISHCFISKY